METIILELEDKQTLIIGITSSFLFDRCIFADLIGNVDKSRIYKSCGKE